MRADRAIASVRCMAASEVAVCMHARRCEADGLRGAGVDRARPGWFASATAASQRSGCSLVQSELVWCIWWPVESRHPPAPAYSLQASCGQHQPAQSASHGHISLRPVPVLRGCARHEGRGMGAEGQGSANAEVKGTRESSKGNEGAGGPSGPGLGLGRRFLAGLHVLRLARLAFGWRIAVLGPPLDALLCSDACPESAGRTSVGSE